MESRKMVQMNLFTRLKQLSSSSSSGDRDVENRLWPWAVLEGRKQTVGQVERVAWKHTSPHVKQPVGICCMTTELKPGALLRRWDGVGGRFKREGIYIHINTDS